MQANQTMKVSAPEARENVRIKVDDQGKYRIFPGITIICPLTNPKEWQEIPTFISQTRELRKYYSPLPLDSYHMTILDLFVQRDKTNEEWASFLLSKSDGFQKIRDVFSALTFTPTPIFRGVAISGVISLEFALSETDSQIISFLRQLLASFVGAHVSSGYVFHMTLAYQYTNPVGQEPNMKVMEEEVRDLASKITTILFNRDNKILLKPAQIIAFDSMADSRFGTPQL